MLMSARRLGQEYGLTAQEMNRVLAKLGFLEGTPGDYTPTEKAIPYFKLNERDNGYGGYARRAWSYNTFDESIKNVLDITDELKNEVRREMSEDRANKKAREEAERLAKIAAEEAIKQAKRLAESGPKKDTEGPFKNTRINEETIRKFGKYGLVAILIAGAIYGTYKAVVYIRGKKDKDRN